MRRHLCVQNGRDVAMMCGYAGCLCDAEMFYAHYSLVYSHASSLTYERATLRFDTDVDAAVYELSDC